MGYEKKRLVLFTIRPVFLLSYILILPIPTELELLSSTTYYFLFSYRGSSPFSHFITLQFLNITIISIHSK